MIRIRHDLKVKQLLKRNNIPIVSNRKGCDPMAGVLVTQYNTRVIVVLNGFLTVEEAYRLMDGLLQEFEIIIYK